MRTELRRQMLMAAALTLVASAVHAAKVITVGDLAEATSARVLAKAMEARVLATKSPDGVSPTATGPHPNLGGAPEPMILSVSRVGVRQYAMVRMPDGSATQMLVGQASENGMVVRPAEAGGVELLSSTGRVVSSYGQPTAAAAIPGPVPPLTAAHSGPVPVTPATSGPVQSPDLLPVSAPPMAPSGASR